VKILHLIKARFLENLSQRDLVDFDPSKPLNVQLYYAQGKLFGMKILSFAFKI
jgi:hypothetical protein